MKRNQDQGGCGTKNSISLDGALIRIWTPQRPDPDHQDCVLGGRMRNLNEENDDDELYQE